MKKYKYKIIRIIIIRCARVRCFFLHILLYYYLFQLKPCQISGHVKKNKYILLRIDEITTDHKVWTLFE